MKAILPKKFEFRNWLKAVLLSVFACLISGIAVGQTQIISGQILDTKTQETVPGVTILIKGTSNGTITDFDGNFSIKAMPGEVLAVSFVGYKTQEISIGNQTTINVGLDLDIKALEEVVVVGYGTVKKSDLTGSVGSVDVKQLQKFSSIDIRQNLQGAVAGVQVTSNSAAPGSGGTSIRVRGIGSMANADPLFVVDGFITGDLSNIAPSDIENMEILKDASATAIYGSRGANGVVLVTTKGAKKGKLKVEVNAYYGFQNIINSYDVLGAREYAAAYLISRFGEEASLDDLAASPTKDWMEGALNGSMAGTDWQEEVTQTAPLLNTELSVSGGTDLIAYKAGATIFSQDGTLVNTYSDRVQLNGSLSINPHKRIKLDATVRYSTNEYLQYNSGTYSSILAQSVRKEPLPSTRLPGEPSIFNDSRITDIGNPALAAFAQKKDITEEKRLNTNLKLTVDILPGLKFNSVFAHDSKEVDRTQDTPEYYSVNEFNDLNNGNEYIFIPNATNDSAFNWIDNQQFTTLQSSNYFNYDKDFGDHSLGVDVGTEYFRTEFDDTPGRETIIPGSNAYTLLSYFARASYGYDSRYLATVTWRRDGSSKFDEEYRWGDFPSFSLAWNLDNESFFPSQSVVSGVKFRGGWGQIGNSNPIGPYRYLALLRSGNVYSFDNVNPSEGIAAEQLPAASLQWETSEMASAGVDLLLLSDRIAFTAEYFVKNTKDLLVPAIPVPNFVGAVGPSTNAASMVNKGIELSLDLKQRVNSFTFNLGGNIAFIKNEVTSLGALDAENGFIAGGQSESKINLPATRTIKGEEFASFYGYQILGVFQSDAEANAHRAKNAQGQPIDAQGNVLSNVDAETFEGTTTNGEVSEQALLQKRTSAGDYKYQDTNFDGKIDEFDAVKLGSAIPDFTYGAYVNIGYKQFDFSLSLSGSQGNEAANVFKYYTEGTTATLNNITAERFNNRWIEGQGNNETAILSSSANAANDNFSSRYVEDASFLRIRNVQLGYTLPSAVLERIKLQRLRVYVSIDNIATFTNYSGLDPEVGNAFNDSFGPGVDYFSYPLARTIFFGTNITF